MNLYGLIFLGGGSNFKKNLGVVLSRHVWAVRRHCMQILVGFKMNVSKLSSSDEN